MSFGAWDWFSLERCQQWAHRSGLVTGEIAPLREKLVWGRYVSLRKYRRAETCFAVQANKRMFVCMRACSRRLM